jgi:hypothetical protein
VLHPVGPLRARVYWRRRLVVLAALLTVLGAGAWGTVVLFSDGPAGTGADVVAEAADGSAVPTPALAEVVPPLSAVRTPAPPRPVPDEPAAAPAPAPAPAAAAAASPAPVAGGPCTDGMLAIEVRAPGSVATGTKPVFELVVRNASEVPCVRDLDKGLQELILLDGGGARVWGSNDCFPESGPDVRTLAPGEDVVFPVVWGGLTSDPDCAAERNPPPPGAYSVRGRLDATISPDAPLTLA